MSILTRDTVAHATAGTRTVVVVSGNPRRGSRTLTVAQALADTVRAGLDGPVASQTIEVADLGPEIFASERPRINGALTAISRTDVLIVATPVYKASYTGLLKLFLDQLPANALTGVTAIPVIISAAPAHTLAAELHLRPLLVELGASVPTRGLAITEAQLPDLSQVVAEWRTHESDRLLRGLSLRVAG